MKQIAPRISNRAAEELAALTAHFEGQRVAIERLIHDGYQKYIAVSDTNRLRAGATDVLCAGCGKPINPGSRAMRGHLGEVYCAECAP